MQVTQCKDLCSDQATSPHQSTRRTPSGPLTQDPDPKMSHREENVQRLQHIFSNGIPRYKLEDWIEDQGLQKTLASHHTKSVALVNLLRNDKIKTLEEFQQWGLDVEAAQVSQMPEYNPILQAPRLTSNAERS